MKVVIVVRVSAILFGLGRAAGGKELRATSGEGVGGEGKKYHREAFAAKATSTTAATFGWWAITTYELRRYKPVQTSGKLARFILKGSIYIFKCERSIDNPVTEFANPLH